MRRGEQNGAAGWAILESAEHGEEQALAGRGEKIDAIEVGEAGECGRIAVCRQPLARIAALKYRTKQGRAGEEITRERVLPSAVFAFDGRDLEMGRSHFRLHKKLSPCGADTYDLDEWLSLCFNKREPGGSGHRLEWGGALHRSQRASPPWLMEVVPGQQWFHRPWRGKHEGRRGGWNQVTKEQGPGTACEPIYTLSNPTAASNCPDSLKMKDLGDGRIDALCETFCWSYGL